MLCYLLEKFAAICKKEILYDDGPLTDPKNSNGITCTSWNLSAGWDDPEMDVYNKLDPRRDNDRFIAVTIVLMRFSI